VHSTETLFTLRKVKGICSPAACPPQAGGLPNAAPAQGPTCCRCAVYDPRLRVRLRRSVLYKTADYSPRLHAAQFQIFLTVQNLNRKSPGYGDFPWLGIPLYDDRNRIPRRFANPDAASKFIYTPSGERYTTQSAHDKNWVIIDRDLLPIIREALRAAWDRRFLKDSRDPADYRVGGINIGWEVPGIFDVEMQVRDLSLKAVTKE